jgi:Protein of Unknown function (DUF2784)
MQSLYSVLNHFFFVSHIAIIFFTLFGWIPLKTRRIHLALMILILFSWFILGIWYGWGYCFWTDWHWKVQSELGIRNLPNSYITFLLNSIMGLDLNSDLVDVATATCFFICLELSAFVNFKHQK